MVTITRCSQPLVGLKQNRSIQDEKLVESIFTTGRVPPAKGQSHLIVDARPSANVIGQTALGAGIESTENYRDCRVVVLGIQNIHVMRDSINKLLDAANLGETGASLRANMDKSGWLNHIRTVLDGTLMIVKSIHSYNTHALIHCSDGWDRTAQLCSLAEICLDPYYRTFEGFAVLIEKEWMSFGHKFRDRLGLLSKPTKEGKGPSVGSQIQAASKTMQFSLTTAAKSLLKQSSVNPSRSSIAAMNGARSSVASSHTVGPQGSVEVVTPNYLASSEVSPVFTQFLDCVYQLWTQFPSQFEFSEKYLLALNCHIHTCQFGTFLLNNERERSSFKFKDASGNLSASIGEATYSIWNFFEHHKSEFLNELYISPENTGKQIDGGVLFPSPEGVRYWMGLYSGQTGFGSESLGEIQPISAATISSMRVSNKQAGTAPVSDIDDENDGVGNWNDSLTNSNASWQSAFSTTAAHVSSLASIASNSWWTVNAATTTTLIVTDPLVDQYQDRPSKHRRESPQQQQQQQQQNRAPSIDTASINSSTVNQGGSVQSSLQEHLAKTVNRQFSDLDLKKRDRNGSTNSSSTNSVESFVGVVQTPQQPAVFELVDNSAAVVVGSGYENLPHPLWQE
ncbi:hypothetical protein HK100_011921 [Physocladia obscura]|uniref:Myotubularin phosphatase domain-containing protein n=1 Tax=Physocladia obscura TaxID=109957 RepID=A0AAD5T0K2_9FUNG|nr:hypothetical protein HK100_011921 [Physocladia obscura]